MITPFMNLTIPTVGVTLGPEWATELNQALTQVDSHDHTSGSGVPIPTQGISLNADLTLNQFNLIQVRSLRMVNQGSPLALPSDLVILYASGGNLYYNNAIGQQVQITQGAGLNAASVGGFGGDYGTSTASAFYTSGTSTFTFWSNTNIPAIMDMGPIVLHPQTSNTFGITLKAPTSLGGNYNLTFPLALPVSTKFMTIDASGNVGDVYDVDGSTIQVISNTIQVPVGGIQIPNLGASNVVMSASSGAFATVSTSAVAPFGTTTITTSGHPVELWLQPDGTVTQDAYIGMNHTGPGGPGSQPGSVEYFIQRNGVTIAGWLFADGFANGLFGLQTWGPGSVRYLDFPPLGVNSYDFFARVVSYGGSGTFEVVMNFTVLVVKETI